MSRRRTVLAAALSLLPLGQPLLLGSTTALATAAVVLSTQAAHAQSATDYIIAGIEKFKRGDVKGAIADYTKAIEINPQYALAYYNRGITKDDLGNYQGAISDYSKAIAINPQDADAYFNRGTVKLRNLKDYQGAIEDFSKSIEINPKDADAYIYRGNAKYKSGDQQGACNDYIKASQSPAKWLNSADGAWCRNMR